MSTSTAQAPRTLTTAELAAVVRLLREARGWSQEQLAEIARVAARTVQRVEDAQPSSLETRRALAGAFGFEDIDAFNKPYSIPTDEELAAAKERFEREHVTLKVNPCRRASSSPAWPKAAMRPSSARASSCPARQNTCSQACLTTAASTWTAQSCIPLSTSLPFTRSLRATWLAWTQRASAWSPQLAISCSKLVSKTKLRVCGRRCFTSSLSRRGRHRSKSLSRAECISRERLQPLPTHIATAYCACLAGMSAGRLSANATCSLLICLRASSLPP
jgi:transcriptional regulator with XRE-family HTH domain